MKRRPRSLRAWHRTATAASITALILSYVLVIPVVLLDGEDRVFSRQMAAWAEYVERNDDLQAARSVVDLGPGVLFAPSATSVSGDLGPWLSRLEAGIHEFNSGSIPGLETRELFVWASEGDDRSYVLFDVSKFEVFEDRPVGGLRWALFIGLFLVAGIAGSGWMFAARISKEFKCLNRLALHNAVDHDGGPIDIEATSIEVAAISKSLKNSMEKTRNAFERERSFARNASHELRTPLTAIRGSAELLTSQHDDGTARFRELSDRLQASISDAESRIEVFLWLAREERPTEPEFWPVNELLTSLAPGSAELTFSLEHDVDVAEAAARTIFQGIIENAARHGEPPLRIQSTATGYEFINRISPSALPSTSGGFGLKLLEELATRLGWTLNTASSNSHFTTLINLNPPTPDSKSSYAS